jgi:hypothetical protein
MRCGFPEHHSAGGTDTGTGGSWGTLGVTVLVVVLLAPLIGVIMHVLALVATFVGIAALASGGGVLWWRLSHRQPRQLRMQYRPQMAPPRWQQPRVEQQQQPAVSGPHLHFHTAEAVEAFRRAVEGR